MSRKIKLQVTLPEEIYHLVEDDARKSFMTKSAWILKAVLAELEKKRLGVGKKVIDLKI